MKNDPAIENLVRSFAEQLSVMVERRVLVETRTRLLESVGGGTGSVGVRAMAAPGRKGPASPGRQLQGKYIGRLRKLKGEARARVQKVARDKGVAAAVKLADKLIG